MRVIAGKFRSRTLEGLEGLETRPTYDRLKETLFNVLASAGMVEGRAWADLFAGTGSVGIEALSRGATSVHFAESGAGAARVLRRNLAALGVNTLGPNVASGLDVASGLNNVGLGDAPQSVEMAERDAAEALRQWERAGVRFDVCFLDPPYRMHGAYGEILRTLARGAGLREGGIAVAEHDKRFDPGEGEGDLRRYRLLKQGDSALSFYRRNARSETTAAEETVEDPETNGW